MTCPYCTATNSDDAKQCHTCGAVLHGPSYSPYLKVGTLLQDGRYAVGKPLGQGGFGITYRGEDTMLHRSVAIKELFPAHSGRNGNAVVPHGLKQADYDAARENFMSESRILASFNHPSIVDAMDVFEENNTSYLIMEFLEGETLEEKLTRDKTMPHEDVLDLAYKLGDALVEVHTANLLHRDIKPANIFLEKDGRAVLIDFGSARTFSANRTMHHTRILTPDYAAPEQFQTQGRFGPYTDLFSLAAVLYHALSGTTPPSAMDRFGGVDLPTLHKNVPKSMRYALEKALSLRIDERWADVKTFIDRLEKAAPPEPQQSTTADQPVRVNSVNGFIRAVKKGGEVYLEPDTYTLPHTLVIDKDVTIVGIFASDNWEALLRCKSGNDAVLDVKGSVRVVLKDIAIEGDINIHDAFFRIDRCYFKSDEAPSVPSLLFSTRISGDAQGKIENSRWVDSEIKFLDRSQVTIRGGHFSETFLVFSDHSRAFIEDSQMKSTDRLIRIDDMYVRNNMYRRRRVSSTGVMRFADSSSGTIKNVVLDHDGQRSSMSEPTFAIRASEAASVNVYESEIVGFYNGITFTAASKGVVSNNVLRSNAHGLAVAGGASPVVTKNVFVENDKSISMHEDKKRNAFENHDDKENPLESSLASQIVVISFMVLFGYLVLMSFTQ